MHTQRAFQKGFSIAFATVALTVLSSACSSSDSSNNTGQTGSAGAGAGGGSSTTAQGGAGGNSLGAEGGAAGSDNTGGASTSNKLNACDPSMAMDMTNATSVTIMFGGDVGYKYDPSCIKIKKGTSVTFKGDFTMHNLAGGTVDSLGNAMPDSNSPIKETKTGMMQSFSFPKAGNYGFYCEFHYGSGMEGALFVTE